MAVPWCGGGAPGRVPPRHHLVARRGQHDTRAAPTPRGVPLIRAIVRGNPRVGPRDWHARDLRVTERRRVAPGCAAVERFFPGCALHSARWWWWWRARGCERAFWPAVCQCLDVRVVIIVSVTARRASRALLSGRPVWQQEGPPAAAPFQLSGTYLTYLRLVPAATGE